MFRPLLEILQIALKLMEFLMLQGSIIFKDFILIQPEINF